MNGLTQLEKESDTIASAFLYTKEMLREQHRVGDDVKAMEIDLTSDKMQALHTLFVEKLQTEKALLQPLRPTWRPLCCQSMRVQIRRRRP